MALLIRFNAQLGIIVEWLELISILNVRAEPIVKLAQLRRQPVQKVHTVLRIHRIFLKLLNVLDVNRERIKMFKEILHASHARQDTSVLVIQ